MLNFVFLDIDGVLNVGGSQKLLHLSDDLVKIANLIGNNDTSFILTSSWGLYHDLTVINDFMKNNGFNYHFKEYLFGEELRSDKIINYIQKNKVDKYAVIDDRGIFSKLDNVNFIKINPLTGITKKDVDAVNEFIL